MQITFNMIIIVNNKNPQNWQHSLITELKSIHKNVHVFHISKPYLHEILFLKWVSKIEKKIRKIEMPSYECIYENNIEIKHIDFLRQIEIEISKQTVINLTEYNVQNYFPDNVEITEIFYKLENGLAISSPALLWSLSNTIEIYLKTTKLNDINTILLSRTTNNHYLPMRALNDLLWNVKDLLTIYSKKNTQIEFNGIEHNFRNGQGKYYKILLYTIFKFGRLLKSKFLNRGKTKWTIFISNVIRKEKTILIPEEKSFWADPFIIEAESGIHIFFEDYINNKNKGVISHAFFKNTQLSNKEIIIEEDFHMSYPFIFQHKNEYYMIPETKENKSIRLYKCLKFPNKWEYHKTLISNIEITDSTILYSENKYWLFGCKKIDNTNNSIERLYLYYTEDLLDGEWKEHNKNPIISDVCSARPAGRIYTNKEGKLIRPSQDSGKTYGYAVNINEITKLDENEYSENLITKIYPENLNITARASHTFNKENEFEIYDIIIPVK